MKLPQWWTTSKSAPAVRYVAGWQRLLIGGLLVALGVLLWAALIGTWPAVTNATADAGSTAAGGGTAGNAGDDAATGGNAATEEVKTAIPLAFGLWRATVSGDTALLVLVIEASLLGSLVHVASSFALHSSRRNLTVSYLWWYPMRFIVGAGLALLLYTALRGGLFTGDFTTQEVNPYGIAAVAGITGMFSKQATAKLAQLFDVAFATQPAKKAPTIDDLDPERVPSGAGDTTIRISGSGFVKGATATAGNTSIHVSDISDTELEIVVPSALLSAPGTIKIRVDNPDPTVGASAPADLTVE